MIQSVDRAVRVLTALQGSRRMALSELATRLELPPSTVHGLIRTLVAHGLVVQERGSTRYQLGPAVLRLGNVYLDTIELRSKAVPWAEDIARRTGFAVRTAVLLLDDVVIIHHEPRPDGSRQMPEVGIVIPAHASALGKAILAFSGEAAGSLSEPLRSMTGETRTTVSALAADLAGVRETGIAHGGRGGAPRGVRRRGAGVRLPCRRGGCDRHRRPEHGLARGAVGSGGGPRGGPRRVA